MFENLRKSLEDLLANATKPEERRAIASRMRDTLVQAKVGLGELQEALERDRQRLKVEQMQLETVRRRGKLAADIGDDETVAIAGKFEHVHAEKVALLEQKIAVQERELALAEREVEEMTAELRTVAIGAVPPATATPEAKAAEAIDRELDGGRAAAEEIDSLARARARADRDSDAARRLEELKRRMGK